ncbi:MAG: hypothetical protein NVS2B4_08210 [Ramlibacter sp.]
MAVDMQTQVWLEAVPRTVPALVVAYVRSEHDARLNYYVNVIKQGPSGKSRIVQSGTVQAAAGAATQLTKLSVSSQPGDDCDVAVSVREGNEDRGTFRFDCPR